MTNRQHYIDWLRVIATIGIFLFHNSRAYDYGDWHIKNAQTSLVATQFVEFMNIWMMPLFFVLSGASVYYSLRSRNGGSFLKERFFRIMIPWLLTGIFVMAPLRSTWSAFHTGSSPVISSSSSRTTSMACTVSVETSPGMHIWYLMQLSVSCGTYLVVPHACLFLSNPAAVFPPRARPR